MQWFGATSAFARSMRAGSTPSVDGGGAAASRRLGHGAQIVVGSGLGHLVHQLDFHIFRERYRAGPDIVLRLRAERGTSEFADCPFSP